MGRKTNAKTAKAPSVPSGRPRLIPSYTDSPTVPGARENIMRVFDPLEAMRKRDQIGKLEYQAALHIRAAHDVIYGSPGGVMDLDRVRGGGSSGPQAAPPYLAACETLRLIKQWLYAMDHRLIELVVVAGYSVADAARAVHGHVPSRSEKEEAGQRLRIGLREVSRHLWGVSEDKERSEIVVARAPDATDYTVAPGIAQRGNTVHATVRKVFRHR